MDTTTSGTMDAQAILAIIAAVFSTLWYLVLTALVVLRKEHQPLKLKSPMLLTIFLLGNIATIVLITLIYINAEVGGEVLRQSARVSGYMMVCFSEPMLLLAFCLRYVRVRKIFDAQQVYFTENKKPQELIDKYSELRLCLGTLGFTAAFTTAYMLVSSLPWAIEGPDGYGVLPTFAIGQFTGDKYSIMSLYFITFGVFAEGILFAYLLDSVKNIKKEFAMLTEM
jgi:hypothetical protein